MVDPYCTPHGHGCSGLHLNLSHTSSQPEAPPSSPPFAPLPEPPLTGGLTQRPEAFRSGWRHRSSFPGQQGSEGGLLRPLRPLTSLGESVKRPREAARKGQVREARDVAFMQRGEGRERLTGGWRRCNVFPYAVGGGGETSAFMP